MSNPLDAIADGIVDLIHRVEGDASALVAQVDSPPMQPLPPGTSTPLGETPQISLAENYGKTIKIAKDIGTTKILNVSFPAPKTINVNISLIGGFPFFSRAIVNVGVGAAKRTYFTDFTGAGLDFSVVCDTIDVSIWNEQAQANPFTVAASYGESSIHHYENRQPTFTTFAGILPVSPTLVTSLIDGSQIPNSPSPSGGWYLPLNCSAFQIVADVFAAGYQVATGTYNITVPGGGVSPIFPSGMFFASYVGIKSLDAGASHSFSVICYVAL
jgi:hypothetical protein